MIVFIKEWRLRWSALLGLMVIWPFAAEWTTRSQHVRPRLIAVDSLHVHDSELTTPGKGVKPGIEQEPKCAPAPVPIFPVIPPPEKEPTSAPEESGPDCRSRQVPEVVETVSPALSTQLRAICPARVDVLIVVNEHGEVEDARVTRSSNPLLNQVVLDAIKQWRFTPGSCDGRPSPFRMMQPIIFPAAKPKQQMRDPVMHICL